VNKKAKEGMRGVHDHQKVGFKKRGKSAPSPLTRKRKPTERTINHGGAKSDSREEKNVFLRTYAQKTLGEGGTTSAPSTTVKKSTFSRERKTGRGGYEKYWETDQDGERPDQTETSRRGKKKNIHAAGTRL